MKVLWITNQATSDIAQCIGNLVHFGGGWMNTLSCQVADKHDLTIIFPYANGKKTMSGKIGNIKYFGIPMIKDRIKESIEIQQKYADIFVAEKPDVVHIWGTEYIHSWDAICASEKVGLLNKVVISIQGLVSIYKNHFWCGLNYNNFPALTIRDFKFKTSIKDKYNSFVKRGYYEKLSLMKVRNVIGRTDWDRACTEQFNPNVNYFFCNETLREMFYKKRWSINNCERHSIFVSQSQYPIKGFHLALETVAILKEKWPDVRLVTTGKDRIHCSKTDILRLGDYDLLLRKKIKDLGLEDNVEFVGMLDECRMCNQYLSSHVFLSPSSIENSPNSVGEAMLLGMPVVSSDVGGVKNMLRHELEGFLYQYDAPYMAAYYIDRIFSNDELATLIGKNAYEHAKQTHDVEQNFHSMIKIYQTISQQ